MVTIFEVGFKLERTHLEVRGQLQRSDLEREGELHGGMHAAGGEAALRWPACVEAAPPVIGLRSGANSRSGCGLVRLEHGGWCGWLLSHRLAGKTLRAKDGLVYTGLRNAPIPARPAPIAAIGSAGSSGISMRGVEISSEVAGDQIRHGLPLANGLILFRRGVRE